MKTKSTMPLFYIFVLLFLQSSCGETRFASSPRERQTTVLESEDAIQADPSSEEIVDSAPLPKEITKEFIAGNIVDKVINVDVVNSTLEDSFILKSDLVEEPFQKKFYQKERPTLAQSFKQGSSGKNIEESFKQDNYGILDLLIVLDNSLSMKDEQKNLSTKLDPLLEYVSESDWQVAVITTDSHERRRKHCLRAVIKKSDIDPKTSFRKAINAGVDGSGDERGILNAARGIYDCGGMWLRPKSSVAVLIVSDEDNCSDGQSCKKDDDAKPSYLIDRLNAIRTVGEDAKVYGIFHKPGMKCETAENVGNIYDQLIRKGKGISGSICDVDYTETLKAISKEVAATLKIQFPLKKRPENNSLKIYIDDELQDPSTYILDDKTVKFSSMPRAGSEIKATYRVEVSSKFKSFKLTSKPFPNSVKVVVDGQPVFDYSIDYANRMIVFDSMPDDNAKIDISYKEDVSLYNNFYIGKDVLPQSITAKVNSHDYSDVLYSADTGMVSFIEEVPEKSEIEISYLKEINKGPILDFEFKTPWSSVRDLKAWDAVDRNQSISVRYANERIIFAKKDFKEGRKVIVSYRDQSIVERRVPLERNLVDGSFELFGVESSGDIIDCDESTYVFNETFVSFKCDVANAAYLYVSYKYNADVRNRFTVEGITDSDNAKWSVWLNEELMVSGYTREGNTIVFDKAPEAGDVIRITASPNF